MLKNTAPTVYSAALDRTFALDQTFEMNETGYRTDAETLGWLRKLVPQAKESGDSSAVIAVMVLGEATGRIVKV
jgi:hypothetical protein